MKRILAGPNAVFEALRAAPGRIEMVCIAETMRPVNVRRLEEQAKHSRVSCEYLPKESLDRLAKGLVHQGVIAITGDYPYVDLQAILERCRETDDPTIVVLDQIQDPRNLGAIMRSAYAFGAAGIVLPKDRAAKVTAAAVRTSAGASELLMVARIINVARTLDDLRDEGFRIYGASGRGGTPLASLDWSGPTALVLGNEGKGLRRLTAEHCDALFDIPMAVEFDSLNVSAAAAIALYEAHVRR